MNPDQVVESLIVPAITFSQLISNHNITRYNLLQIDTEGHDYRILKMALAETLRPEIINYEHINLSQKERNLAEALLTENGYKYLPVGLDTVAMLSANRPL